MTIEGVYICYLPDRRSVWEKTVPVFLITVKGQGSPSRPGEQFFSPTNLIFLLVCVFPVLLQMVWTNSGPWSVVEKAGLLMGS